MRSFYPPDFPEIGYLKKWGGAQGMDENFRKNLIKKYLPDSEIVYLSKAFGSKNLILKHNKCDEGWLFVTDKRILFWSDNSTKPNVAIDFQDIKKCRTSKWGIMKQRSITIQSDGFPVLFVTHKEASKLISKALKS
jgi:hypothetical protein